jgi:hypothetical protein
MVETFASFFFPRDCCLVGDDKEFPRDGIRRMQEVHWGARDTSDEAIDTAFG